LGAEQQEALEKIKEYLSAPPVLCAPRRGVPFKLYIAAKEKIIGVVLTQEDKGKEYVIAYLGRRLLDPETRYAHIEKLCLSLYYTCSKMRHYLLSSTCVVVCQADVIKNMLYRPILRGRIGKWAYALIEYDLTYKPLKTLKGQVLVDFIVEHGIDLDDEINYLTFTPWKLYLMDQFTKMAKVLVLCLFPLVELNLKCQAD
jgi:hypothetical protein